MWLSYSGREDSLAERLAHKSMVKYSGRVSSLTLAEADSITENTVNAEGESGPPALLGPDTFSVVLYLRGQLNIGAVYCWLLLFTWEI